MTKFDKLRELFVTWWDSHAPECYDLYDRLMAYTRELFPTSKAGFWATYSNRDQMVFYVRRTDYLGRLINVAAFATPQGIEIQPDPRTGKVNNRLKQHFEVLHDQV